MSPPRTQEIIRSTILHTPRSPFQEDGALEAFEDGALLIDGATIQSVGDYGKIHAARPEAPVRDLRGGVILPGLIDTHVHFPQLRIIGGLGCGLLEWLDRFALPEEIRMGDGKYAGGVAAEFVSALASHGTTTALVFGSHFAEATAMLFEAAEAKGLRVASGLVLSDRLLPEALHSTPERACDESRALVRRFHGRGGLRYAVTPRFALSASEGMLEVCRTLMNEFPDVLFQTHLNENTQEVADVLRAFPWAQSYLGTYDRFGLVGPRSIFAHNVHAQAGELERMADAGAAVAHCPCSNAALGSGFFPMARHLAAGVRIALGTDVGAGTGFGMLKEALQCYLLQRLMPGGVPLTAAHLLYLATRAGAEALGVAAETGDFTPGKSADLVYVRPREGSVLAAAMGRAESAEQLLAAVLTLAGAESISEVLVRGRVVHG
ncbi:MAG: guanine deaminase [Candidatus Solibacter sp.]